MKVAINALSPDSLLKAAKKIKAYENKVLANNREFLKDLALEGIMEADASLQDVASDYTPPNLSTHSPHVMNGEKKGDMSVTLRLQGEQAVFVEFGAGVYYNGAAGSSPHPYGVELGYTIGDYGWGFGQFDEWGYTDANGKYRLTHGTPAAMPLYNAGVAIRQNARVLALAHFRSY